MQPGMAVQSTSVVGSSIAGLWVTIFQFLPVLLAAIIVFFIGWVFAILLYRAVVELVRFLRIDRFMQASGLTDAVRAVGFKLDVGAFFAALVFGFVLLAFLIASLEILGLSRVTLFFEETLLLYIPQVIIAALIIIIAAVLADFVQKVISRSAHIAGAPHGAPFAGALGKWAIWILAVLAALNQLGIAADLVQTIFTGMVIAFSIAAGLAFGLGGKDTAARIIQHISDDLTHKNH